MTTETGHFCEICQIHRVQTAGAKCPVCLSDDERSQR